MSDINILELIKQTDLVVSSFQTLLLPCPFCGNTLSERELTKWDGKPGISCVCGARMPYNMGILDLITLWNRRDGVEFTLESEYAKRLLAVQSMLANCERKESEMVLHMQKEITRANDRATKAEQELAKLREAQS